MSSTPTISAILGPTNTGKTHVAMERLANHDTGMMGFPLRLLARENYDRLVKIKGPSAVALITGEERLAPPNARYFICTVEAMPVDKRVDFLAVDEIQLASDPERGHIFTDRLLNARGRLETMFIGADTIKPILRKLVPEIEITSRPRLSTLSYTGYKRLTRLPKRSAVVAFSASDVYALGELMRRQQGGTAIVMGALSPRARNAQVGMYQAGEVDFIVATDAIGMGLNMDIDHVAFASLHKFDGRKLRRLTAPEMGQIAGRAGRHLAEGTFGTTADAGSLEDELVKKLESHQFDRLDFIYWRNSDLEFRSLDALRKSLDVKPPYPYLHRPLAGDDIEVLDFLSKDPMVRRRAQNPGTVRLLWEVCQIPDFRKSLSEVHAGLLKQIFLHVSSNQGRLPREWVSRQVDRLNRSDGDIDTLMSRLAHIRTWTYVTQRQQWIDDADEWQARTREIEDKLSDALHHSLTNRFVDKRLSALVSKLGPDMGRFASIDKAGEVWVSNQVIGEVEGLRLKANADFTTAENKAALSIARPALQEELRRRLHEYAALPFKEFFFEAEGKILVNQQPIAVLRKGPKLLKPDIELLLDEDVADNEANELRKHLRLAAEKQIAQHLKPLVDLEKAPLPGAARGVAFQLAEHGGCLPLEKAGAVKPLERRVLTQHQVVAGLASIHIRNLYSPAAMLWRRLLWVAFHQQRQAPPLLGKIAVPLTPQIPDHYYWANGFLVLEGWALRADRLERLLRKIQSLQRRQASLSAKEAAKYFPVGLKDLAGILRKLGYRVKEEKAALHISGPFRKEKKGGKLANPDSPFALLEPWASKKD
ncbi:MAG: helicase-related protein [Dongiaceae bacterium]